MTEQPTITRFDVVSLGETMLRLSVPIGMRLDDARALEQRLRARVGLAVALLDGGEVGRRDAHGALLSLSGSRESSPGATGCQTPYSVGVCRKFLQAVRRTPYAAG